MVIVPPVLSRPVAISGMAELESIALDRHVGDAPNTVYSNASAASDDSLFEWIFGANYVVADGDVNGVTLANCGPGAPPVQNCADYALRNDLGATVIEGDCASNQFSPESFGLYYVTGNCTISGLTVGSKNAPVIIVVFGQATLKNAILFGMLFVHSDNIALANASSGYRMDMQSATIFGSLVVEGDLTMTGNSVIVYDDTSLNNDPYKLPTKARFARVPGSWLDRQQGF